MPDFFNDPSHMQGMDGAPRSWSEAFAALPAETPPGDGWARITRRLDASVTRRGVIRRERRVSWLIGLASAAVLVLAAWSPLSHWLHAEDRAEVRPPVVATTAPDSRPATAARIEPDPASIDTTAPGRDDTRIASSASPQVARATHRKASQIVRRAVAKRSGAHAAGVRTHSGSNPPASEPETGNAIAAATPDPLQKLKTQSAQLEALVALARDDRVGNASSTLLSGEIDAGIATVDAALSQTELTDARKQELWQQRVDLLQQLAGVEATSRWLAAQGASNETRLVSVD